MPGTCESARSVRRCKACLHPVKGHPGPYGLARCSNRVAIDSSKSNKDSISSKTIIELVDAFQAVDVATENVNEDLTERLDESVKNATYTLSSDIHLPAAVELGSVTEVNVTPPVSAVDGEESIRNSEKASDRPICSPLVSPSPLPADSSSSQAQLYQERNWGESDSDSEDHSSDSDNSSHFLSDPEEFSVKINDIVARLDSSSSVAEEAQSDQLDIRPVLAGGQFCICHCPPGSDVSSCQCEGELLLDSQLAGVVENQVFIALDPSQAFQEDLKPKVICGVDSWCKERACFVELRMIEVETNGVVLLEGKICLEAALETGPSGSVGVVRGTMSLVLEVGEEFEKKGFKNPVSYKPVQFQLIRLEEDEVLSEK